MTELARLSAAYRRAEARTEKARQELYAGIRKARAAGESVALIAQVAGVTRERVYQITSEE